MGKEVLSYPKAGGDIRFVVATGCQSGCNFCHLEGHKNEDELGTLNPALAGWKTAGKDIPLIDRLGNAVRDDDVSRTVEIANRLGLNKIHLTGGEPTLHPETPQIISSFVDADMQVGMTTHGEIGSRTFEQFLGGGLKGINFSVHAATPEQYVAMDLIAQQTEEKYGRESALRYAQSRLNNKQRNIRRAVAFANSPEGKGFKVKANSVVQDVKAAIDVVKWCNEEGVAVRLQRDLNNKETSQVLIDEVIGRLGAQPVAEYYAVGDSSGSGTDYEYDGGSFRVKHFGEIYVSEMCDSCSLQGTPDCRERFYGVRVEHSRVTTCIDVNEPQVTSFGFDEFVHQIDSRTGVGGAVLAQYEAMRLE